MIVSDNDTDNENSVKGSPSRYNNYHRHRNDNSEQEENQSDNESMRGVDDGGSDNLAGLSQAELKQKFDSEVCRFLIFYLSTHWSTSKTPRWNDRTSRRPSRQALDVDDIAIPPVTGEVDLTTASEFGGDRGDDGGENDDEIQADDEIQVDDEIQKWTWVTHHNGQPCGCHGMLPSNDKFIYLNISRFTQHSITGLMEAIWKRATFELRHMKMYTMAIPCFSVI